VSVAPTYAGQPVPAGRSRWRLTLHRRQFTSIPYNQTIIAELTDARSAKLVCQWNTPAELTFTLDGHDMSAPLVQELGTDVIAWRWDETLGRDVAMVRALVDHSEDQVSEDGAAVTNFTAHDYLAMLQRRILTTTYSVTGRDQDLIVVDLLNLATSTAASSSGTSFMPGSYLPLDTVYLVNADGTSRGQSGQLRDRTYAGSSIVSTLISDLALVQGGFDYMVRPLGGLTRDWLLIYYNPTPGAANQGVVRNDVPLVYGSTVAALTRTVESGTYANYVRTLGNNQSSLATDPQVFAEAWSGDANNVTVIPTGLWQLGTSAADVTLAGTLSDQANGTLNLDGVIVPTYTLTLAPDAYRYGFPNMGDTCPLVVKKGRLNVNSVPPTGGVRVMGITYNVLDDGGEDVELVLGRPATTLLHLFTQANRDLDALTRR
jgi:hypothetical protein